MKKIFSLKNALLCIILILIAIASATFIERNMSVEEAWELVYHSLWFEFLVYAVVILMLFNIVYSKMYNKAKWSMLLIHFAVIFIVMGGIISKYTSYEGQMNILSSQKKQDIYEPKYSMRIEAVSKDGIVTLRQVGRDDYQGVFKLFDEEFTIEKKHYLEYAKQKINPLDERAPGVIDFEILSKGKREAYIFEGFGRVIKDGVEIVFNKEPLNKNKPYIKIVAREDSMIHFISNRKVVTNFEEELVSEENNVVEFHPGIIYTVEGVSILIDDITTIGNIETIYDKEKIEKSALITKINYKGQSKLFALREKGPHYSSYQGQYPDKDLDINIFWEKKKRELPFEIELKNFEIKRYYGSDIASSYESKIVLHDLDGNVLKEHDLKINHPLRYQGYSIFQTTSQAYGGTVLNINYNPAMWLIYVGYFLLTLGLVLNLFNSKGRFAFLRNSLKELNAQ